MLHDKACSHVACIVGTSCTHMYWGVFDRPPDGLDLSLSNLQVFGFISKICSYFWVICSYAVWFFPITFHLLDVFCCTDYRQESGGYPLVYFSAIFNVYFIWVGDLFFTLEE